ncbi:hypothetical protein [Thermoactinomyces sp. DSM 45892]|uniref:hypothetical protein n=1 Tax=Thermoactinomyces sp. DSM 45892 TaxID=1882753 RepID=UPI00089A721A|nr:hypothetical protein [Thermoactinomyces sp. DSM 45892]SDY48965.1 hypothetical protein SAMN05444416_10573 [Thermoactinomyces sp. DSM 45892]
MVDMEQQSQSQTKPSQFVSRREKYAKKIKMKPAAWFAWFSVVLVALAIPVGFYAFKGSSSNQEAKSPPVHTETEVGKSNPSRPRIELQPHSGGKDPVEPYRLGNVEKVEVSLSTKSSASFKVYRDSSKGTLLREGELSSNNVEKIEDKKELYVFVEKPDQVELKVNGIQIDTSNSKSAKSYRFFLVE